MPRSGSTDRRIGEHEGGYLPFEFDVAGTLRPGARTSWSCRVVDASDDRSRYPESPFSEVPHGKQSWYGPIGGIWQSVWLEIATERCTSRDVRLTPDAVADGRFEIAATLSAPLPANALAASQRSYATLTAQRSPCEPHWMPTGTARPQLRRRPLWSPDTPTLYTV